MTLSEALDILDNPQNHTKDAIDEARLVSLREALSSREG